MIITADDVKPLGFALTRLFKSAFPDGIEREELLRIECGGWLKIIQDAVRRRDIWA